MTAAPIRSVAVLGAGTMGAQIAAHLSNAGLSVVLLDVSRDAAAQGLARLRKTKPDPAGPRAANTHPSASPSPPPPC